MRSLRLLAAKEFSALLAAPACWLFLICVAGLTGYSFLEATRLFAEASRSAARSPELARGLSPFDGVFVPTFGGLYLASTLLYPFLAIRFISSEKESGSLKITLQLPVSIERVVAAKVAALAVGWGAALLMPLSAAVLWMLKGGHVGAWELATLSLGHALYAFAVTGTALLAAAVADSTAAAALLSLAVVLGDWALDFSAAAQTGWVRTAAALSPSGCLHSFEKGLFASPQLFSPLALGVACLASGAVWLRGGESRARRGGRIALILAAAVLACALFSRVPFYADAAEDARNSFPPADARALSRLAAPLDVKVYLNPEDSRLWDLERSVLSKLRRAVPDIRIGLEPSAAFTGPAGDDRYGLIVIAYEGRSDRTRSTGEEEILGIIYGLAGMKAPSGSGPDYPGYPLTADFSTAALWFYALLPALLAASWRGVVRRTS